MPGTSCDCTARLLNFSRWPGEDTYAFGFSLRLPNASTFAHLFCAERSCRALPTRALSAFMALLARVCGYPRARCSFGADLHSSLTSTDGWRTLSPLLPFAFRHWLSLRLWLSWRGPLSLSTSYGQLADLSLREAVLTAASSCVTIFSSRCILTLESASFLLLGLAHPGRLLALC